MKISSKTLYGIRFLLVLADDMSGSYKQLNEIAKSESISEKFLESIAGQLKSGGIVDVKRGSKGGYRLSRSPEKIFINDLFNILDGEKLFSDRHDDNNLQETINKVAVLNFLSEFEKNINDFLSLKTLYDIILLKAKININHYYQI